MIFEDLKKALSGAILDLKPAPIPDEVIEFEEVTFRNILSMLRSASHSSYIIDDEPILDDFEINDISGYGSIAYGENMIDDDLSKNICRIQSDCRSDPYDKRYHRQ